MAVDCKILSLAKELIMEPLKTDLSIYQEFKFERPPVGVKFLPDRPEGMEQLRGSMALCEMINQAQRSGDPFYISKDNEDCAGAMLLGMVEPRPMPGGGELGVRYGIFGQASANEKLIEDSPKMEPGAINYVAFAPLDKLTFEPDLLFILADTGQAEILLRAMSYMSGELWRSQITPVGACTWMFAYPYQSGKVNYVTTGLTFGLRARKVYPAGLLLFSIPQAMLAEITRNLEKMEWVLPSYTDKTREEFLVRRDKLFADLAREFGGA
jgi:uncharacterized protein (DUF169 family)